MLFIATANTLSTIPPALLDRMEVIELSGYTEQEKLAIAEQYLVPRQIEAHGLAGGQVKVERAALEKVIGDYTREAGVRNLERHVATLMRKSARRIAGAARRRRSSSAPTPSPRPSARRRICRRPRRRRAFPESRSVSR